MRLDDAPEAREAEDDPIGSGLLRTSVSSVSAASLLAAVDSSQCNSSNQCNSYGTLSSTKPMPSTPTSAGFESERKVIAECTEQAYRMSKQVVLGHDVALLQRVHVENVLHETKKSMRGCVMMLLTLVFFALYTTSSYMHEEIVKGFLMQIPLQEALSEGLPEILTVDDVWTWVEGVYIPTFFRQTNMYGEPLPPSDWSRILQYSQLQGSVRLSQARSMETSCEDELTAHLLCYPQTELSGEPFGRPLGSLPAGVNLSVIAFEDEGFVVEPSGRRLRPRREEMLRWMPPAGSDSNTFRFYLHRLSPLEEIRQRVQYLRARRWLDEQSTQMQLEALVLNPEGDRPKIDRVKVTFYFSRGGGVFSALHFQSVFLRPWKNSLSLAIDVLFLVLLVIFTVLTFHGLFVDARRGAVKSQLSLANLAAWLNVGLSWASVGFFYIQDALGKDVASILETLAFASGEEYHRAELEIHEAMEAMLIFTSWFHTVSTYMVLLLMARSFLYLECQPRLALVLKTLKVASVDLAHFLIIIMPTFVAYGIAGMCIFGRRVDEFSSIHRAIGTCFKIAIESEFDWVNLSAEHPFTAASWVWTYVLLIVMIMLNMVLAIIMDVYTEVRSENTQVEPIWDSVAFAGKRIWARRQWVPNDVVLQRLKDMPEVFTTVELQRAFLEMPDWQFEWLKTAARAKVQNFSTGQDEQFRMQMLAAMIVSSDMAQKSLHRMLHQREVSEEAERPKTRSDEICYEDIVQSMAVQNHWMMNVQEQLDQIRMLQRGATFSSAATAKPAGG